MGTVCNCFGGFLVSLVWAAAGLFEKSMLKLGFPVSETVFLKGSAAQVSSACESAFSML